MTSALPPSLTRLLMPAHGSVSPTTTRPGSTRRSPPRMPRPPVRSTPSPGAAGCPGAPAGIVSFPAEPAAVCAYLTGCADQGLSLATIDSACSAIGHQHRSRGVSDPIEHHAVRQVRRGLRRIIGRAPRRPARPLSVADVRQIVAAIDRTTIRGVPRHRPHPARVCRRPASLRARRPHPG